MRNIMLSILFAICLFFASSTALRLERRTSPKVLSMPIKGSRNPPFSKAKRKDDTVSLSLHNEKFYYTTEIQLGTPPQKLTMVIDTGNSDSWVHDAESDICKEANCDFGTFNASGSSSFRDEHKPFSIVYFDNKNASGGFGTDKLKMGSVNLKDFEFGLANDSNTLWNMLGLSYATGEAVPTYYTFPDTLVKEDVVKSAAFSLWLNDVEESKGEILFGGINKAKFKGELKMVQVVPDPNSTYKYAQFRVNLKSVNLDLKGDKKPTSVFDAGEVAVIDSGSPYIRMPINTVQKVLAALDAYGPTPEYGIPPYMSCQARKKKGTFDFTFDGGTIKIPIDKLVFPAKALGMNDSLHSNACVLGMVATKAVSGLGNTFLRNTYTVFDLDNYEIGMAESNFDKTIKDDILEINPDHKKLPKVTGLGKTSAAQAPTPYSARNTVLALLAGFLFNA